MDNEKSLIKRIDEIEERTRMNEIKLNNMKDSYHYLNDIIGTLINRIDNSNQTNEKKLDEVRLELVRLSNELNSHSEVTKKYLKNFIKDNLK
ncbi:hypothetical protein [Staphylococcus phage vB_StaM_PB50]|nr:hypothetical protein [Staphylococcus phage vB_StaM_PB50]